MNRPACAMTMSKPFLAACLVCVSLWQAPALAEGCRAMKGSAVGVVTSDAFLPERCDEPGKCRIFDMEGKQIGAVGDFIVPGTISEGLAAVRLKETDLQGYMDPSGNWVIEAQFKRAGPFCEGRAAVQRADGRHVYIDRSGKEVGNSYDDAEAFTEGRGLVSVFKGGDKWLHGYVDLSGKLVIPATFAAARLFSEGRAAVRADNGRWGYIDRDGKLVIEPQFGEADLFHSGRAVIRTSEDWARNAGLIDETGKLVMKARYEVINQVGDAELWGAGITDPGYRGGGEPPLRSQLFDRDGHAVSASLFNSFGAMAEGLIDVCRSDKCGFVDLAGRAVIALRFKHVEPFAEGLAAVSLDGHRYGFIDHSGKFVIEPRYDGLGPNKEYFAAGPFEAGLAPAGCRGRWGFIDKAGAWVIPPVYLYASSFENGFAAVTIKAGTVHVRTDGTPIDFSASESDRLDLPARPCGAKVRKPAAN